MRLQAGLPDLTRQRGALWSRDRQGEVRARTRQPRISIAPICAAVTRRAALGSRFQSGATKIDYLSEAKLMLMWVSFSTGVPFSSVGL